MATSQRTLPLWESLTSLVEAIRVKTSVQKKLANYQESYGRRGDKVTIEFRIVQRESYRYDYSLGIYIGEDCYQNLFTFSASAYPACCGLTMFHTFSYNKAYVTEAEVHAFLSDIMQNHASRFWGGWNNKHLELVMVSEVHSGYNVSNDKEVPDDIDDQKLKVQYPWIYSYFMKTAKKVSAQSFWNVNSNHLLHRLDVLY